MIYNLRFTIYDLSKVVAATNLKSSVKVVLFQTTFCVDGGRQKMLIEPISYSRCSMCDGEC